MGMMSSDERVVVAIMVGGPTKGTRFRPLSQNIPKPLFSLAGQAMVHHPISACKKLLLVDKIITTPKEMYKILDIAVKTENPIVIIVEGIEKEALVPIIRNKLKGIIKVAAAKGPDFGKHNLTLHWLDTRLKSISKEGVG